MRQRTGNPFREAHGRTMRHYEWIAPVGTKPADIPGVIETALVLLGVKLQATESLPEQHGHVNTSLRPDGSLFVCVCLYDTPCSNANHSHGRVVLRAAPALTVVDEAAMVTAVGEHARHTLNGQTADDVALLQRLGFRDADAPLRDA